MRRIFLSFAALVVLGAAAGHWTEQASAKVAPKKPAKKPAAVDPNKVVIDSSTATVAQIAEVRRVDGKGPTGLHFHRKGNAKDYTAFEGMKGNLHDVYSSDGHTASAIEFFLGGAAAIPPNSVIEIVSERKAAGQPHSTIIVQKGAIWANVEHQHQTLQIQTNGGVMGIKGTEFVVEAEPDGQTSLGVLHGDVTVTDNKGTKLDDVTDGQQLTFGNGTPTRKTYTENDLRAVYKQTFGQKFFEFFNGGARLAMMAQQSILVAKAAGASGDGPDAAYRAAGIFLAVGGTANAVVNNPGDAAADAVNSRIGFNVMQKSKPFPADLCPDFQSSKSDLLPAQVSPAPVFTWKKVNGANGYTVVVSKNEDMSDPEWSEHTYEGGDCRLEYPETAKPLAPGRHYWLVTGVDLDGKPIKQASKTYFDVT